jgi:hypothetical protein
MAKARTLAGAGGSFEELVIAGLGRLSHDTVGRCLVGFIVALCAWTFAVHWLVVAAATWGANAALAVLTTGLHQVLHGYGLNPRSSLLLPDTATIARGVPELGGCRCVMVALTPCGFVIVRAGGSSSW